FQATGKMRRRSLLLGLGSLALTQLVHACGLRGRSPQFVVEFLASSIPASLLKRVEAQLQATMPLKLTPVSQLADSQLSTWLLTPQSNDGDGSTTDSQPTFPNLASLGDSWLALAIQSQSLQPLAIESQSGWNQLPAVFQQLVQRNGQGNLDPSGEIWAAPYRWGQLMIAYRADKLDPLGWTPTDWNNLWDQPVERRLSLPDHERLVLGLVLKAMGQSINVSNLGSINDLADRLASLQQQVKFYSSDNYLQPLFLEDTWVAVGWSMDILPVVQRDPRIKAIVPTSGTILNADLWVQPHQAVTPDTEGNAETIDGSSDGNDATAQFVQDWINFFWEPDIAIQLSLLSSAASPMILDTNLALNSSLSLPSALLDDRLLIPSAEILAQSEFIQPLDPGAIAQYQQYWQTMRTPVNPT
ncbi:MAG: extracellular solute-binding protein, partial [Cyanothece sp. SIO2G6]|nr:extracellular solute-binding protein [Cyanothece sp. SIO2G6]